MKKGTPVTVVMEKKGQVKEEKRGKARTAGKRRKYTRIKVTGTGNIIDRTETAMTVRVNRKTVEAKCTQVFPSEKVPWEDRPTPKARRYTVVMFFPLKNGMGEEYRTWSTPNY